MAQQPSSAQYHQGRAVRNWVSAPVPLAASCPSPPRVRRAARADPYVASAALCQVFDSIYLDVPMSRVKFNVNTEYAYIQNFKVLQSGCRRRRFSSRQESKQGGERI